MRVADLDGPRVGLRRVRADAAALERPVTGTTTVDLRDPGRYVATGHLVLTGLAWRRGPGDSAVFADALEEAGAAALAVGEALLGEVPEDVVDAAARVGLPLFAVPVDVAFHRVSAAVEALTNPRDDTVQRLLAAAAAGRPLPEVVAEVPGVRVLSATGRQLAGDPLGEDDVDALFAGGAPGRPVGEGPDPWWLVPAGVPETSLTALTGVLVLHRRVPVPAADPHGGVVGLAAAPDVLPLVLDAVADHPHRLVHARGATAVVVQAGPTGEAAPLERRLRRAARVLGRPVLVGVSRVGGDDGDVVAGAQRALRAANPRTGCVLAREAEPGHVVDLLRAVPAADRRRFARHALAAVLDDPELLLTLRTHLRSGRSAARTAAELHLHQNTVRYRLSRVEVLLGRDLRDVDDVVDLHVALRSLEEDGG